ncbi:TPA: urease accessory protein UreE [Escherichia coli]|nr:urease accessory protein UreE [Escherichia coli]HBA9522907.1 urease accessory protein UreE [Escherichia coli]HBA9550841.1 urease accessory protein UreE [Escherichia coli]HBA9560313.1 urease accessory protein UreE [Escherichia coli]
MILIERVLGNIKNDPAWQTKLKDATIDLLALDQREAQKSRCRKLSSQGVDLGISLERNVVLTDGDVLFWNDELHMAIVVQIQQRDVMVISLSGIKKYSSDELIKTCFELGHVLGNQHWKAVTKNNEVYVPLTVAPTMMDSVMKTHGFQHLPYHFAKGAEILPLLSHSEARLLLGGAEDTDTHVHVSHGENQSATSGLHTKCIQSHNHGHSHGVHKHEHKG